jgi:hypothetical protein
MAKGVCFVAMPAGRTDQEKSLYMGWFEDVYKPAIEAEGVECVAHHFSFDDAPESIKKSILNHLLKDDLAIFDLAGLAAGALPNPNVIYELGIRHAFQKPSVIYGWRDQPLPFDIAPQRAVLVERTIAGAAQARAEIAAALKKAKQGHFYNPLEDLAQAQLIAKEAGRDSVLGVLAQNVETLTQQMNSVMEKVGEIQRATDVMPAPSYAHLFEDDRSHTLGSLARAGLTAPGEGSPALAALRGLRSPSTRLNKRTRTPDDENFPG